MKSCICKERIHWKQRPKNIYDVDKKIKAYTWKWDLFRLKQRTYTSLGVVIVPHVNCTQNDGTKCSFFTGSNRTNRCIMICIRKHVWTHARLQLRLRSHTHNCNKHLHIHSTSGLIYTSDIINVEDIMIIFQLGFLIRWHEFIALIYQSLRKI